MPRWAQVLGTIFALVLLLVVGKLTGIGGEHGPGRHMGTDGSEQETDPGRSDGDHDLACTRTVSKVWSGFVVRPHGAGCAT